MAELMADPLSISWTYGTFSHGTGTAWSDKTTVTTTCFVSTGEVFDAIENVPPLTSDEWQWVAVVGRDEGAGNVSYQAVLKRIGEHYGIDANFVNAERLSELVMPQYIASAINPHQSLIVARVANPTMGSDSDSTTRLSNRWLIIVDSNKKVVLLLTRIDTDELRFMRERWTQVCREFTMTSFIGTLLAKTLQSYIVALKVQERLIDLCESRLLSVTMGEVASADSEQMNQFRSVVGYFDCKHDKQVIREMMRRQGRQNGMRGTIFFYHVVRALRVQHRVLCAFGDVLAKPTVQSLIGAMAPQLTSRCEDITHRALNRRDDAQQLLDTAMNLSSYRTNELMSVLTKVSIVCTPPMLLAAVYGMNFEYMPELSWRYGYAFFWVCAIALAVCGYLALRIVHIT